MKYWEDRLTDEQYAQVEKAQEALQAGNITGDEAYEQMTNAGMTAEEADEMINAMLQ